MIAALKTGQKSSFIYRNPVSLCRAVYMAALLARLSGRQHSPPEKTHPVVTSVQQRIVSCVHVWEGIRPATIPRGDQHLARDGAGKKPSSESGRIPGSTDGRQKRVGVIFRLQDPMCRVWECGRGGCGCGCGRQRKSGSPEQAVIGSMVRGRLQATRGMMMMMMLPFEGSVERGCGKPPLLPSSFSLCDSPSQPYGAEPRVG